MIKTRFAPSPTGLIHLGNARIALFNYLFALHLINQKQDAKFVLRIEDTDTQRSQEKFINQIKVDLNWLGIEVDDKEIIRQSQREKIYIDYFNLLLEQKKIYPCFCSEKRLEELRAEQIKLKKPPNYDGKCANLAEIEISQNLKQNIKPAYRFRLNQKEITLNDLRHGKKHNLSKYGDFIIRKPNHQFVFLFTNLVDDIEQKITHSVRGEDHLTNSILQTALGEAFHLKVPTYLHLSLITNSRGKPLSKRDGGFALKDLRLKSYHPLAVVNYLARLGHSLNNNKVLNINDLAHYFNFENLTQSLAKSASQFDISQLNFWQKQTIYSLDVNDLIVWLKNSEVIADENINNKQIEILKIIQQNIVFAEDYVELIQIFNPQEINFLDKNQSKNQSLIETIEETPKLFLEIIKLAVIEKWEYDKLLSELKSQTHLKAKALFIPLRIIISSQSQGPKIQDLYKTIEPELILKRVQYCLKFKEK